MLVALAVWAVWAEPALWAMCAAYGTAWGLVSVVMVRWPELARVPVSRVQAVALAVLVGAGPVAMLWRARGEIVEAEGLLGIEASLADRVRLEGEPAIAPPLVTTDRPQTFYVRASGAERVGVRLGEGVRELEGAALGAGLFRVSYDPRRDGVIDAVEGEVDVGIAVDGEVAARAVTLVRPVAHPRWLCVSRDRTLAAAVSEETDELFVVNAGGLVRRVEVGDGPSDCAFVDERRVLVSHRFERALGVIDARTGESAGSRVELGRFQGRLAVSPGGPRVAVLVDGIVRGVHVLALPSLAREGFVALDAAPDWIAFGADDETLVVSSRRPAALHRLRRGADGHWARDGAPLLLGRPAVTMARSADGTRVIVAVTDFRADGRVHSGNHFVQDQLLEVDVARWRVVSQRLTQRRSARQGSPGNVDRGVSPMAVDATGDATHVAFAGTDEVWTIRAERATPVIRDLSDWPLAAPHGVAELAGGELVVSSPSQGAIGVLGRDGSLAALVRLAPDDETLLREAPETLKRRMGERGFYESTRSGVSCQSCHLHADTDGALHDVGEGSPSPTLTVRGVAGTAPYLRDGSYPRVRDLDDLSHGLYRGFLRWAPSRGLTLEAYVYGLPRLPSVYDEGERDVSRERRGLAAFVEARCPTCHAFPAFTNLGQHPAGTMFPGVGEADDVLDTPSLLAVRWTAPFLTDGRAETLGELLREHDPAERHGEIARLSEQELEDLIFFLESL